MILNQPIFFKGKEEQINYDIGSSKTIDLGLLLLDLYN